MLQLYKTWSTFGQCCVLFPSSYCRKYVIKLEGTKRKLLRLKVFSIRRGWRTGSFFVLDARRLMRDLIKDYKIRSGIDKVKVQSQGRRV